MSDQGYTPEKSSGNPKIPSGGSSTVPNISVNMTPKMWAEVQVLSNRTGMPPEEIIARSIQCYKSLYETFKRQNEPDAEIHVYGKRRRIIEVLSNTYTRYTSAKDLLGLK